MKEPRTLTSIAANRRRILAASAATLTGWLAVPGRAAAQERLKQATFIVGSPPGGATDKLTRMVAEGLRQSYAATVIVENRPGAGGAIAYEYVKNSGVRDGSLMFLSPAYPIVISPHVVSNLPYDPLTDFIPVGIAARSMLTIVVGPAVPAEVRSLADYLRWCRDNPKQAVYAAQTGSSQHLAGTSFALAARLPWENVSYKGDAPAVQDVLGGHMPAIILPIASAIPHHRSGRMRVLAVTGANRSRFLPDVATLKELGYPDIRFQDWLGVFAPAGTPPETVARINAAMAEVVNTPQGGDTLAAMGFEPDYATPPDFAAQVRADHARYGQIVAKTGFREAVQKASGR